MASNRPASYSGNEPFAFISYAHKDADRVYPIIEGLQKRGVRVWYDEGLELGSHWDEMIAQHLIKCNYVICFISNSFLKSENCKNEIHMAAEEGKGPLLTYLERVELPPAMKLQYGRRHALSLSQYESLESFIDHIAASEMLQSCCSNPAPKRPPNTKQPPYTKQPEAPAAPTPKAPNLIRNVCTKGSCDFDHAFPTDGVYSDVINRDRWNVIYFHIDTTKFYTDSLSGGMRIFDSNGNLVHEVSNSIAWQPDYDRLSRSWVIRGRDGTFVPTGSYRAEIWVENSAVFVYHFTITSDRSPQPSAPVQSSPEIQKLQKKLQYPKVIWPTLLTAFGFILFMATVEFSSPVLPLTGLICLIIGYVKILRFTRKNVVDSWFAAVLLTIFLNVYYWIYLFLRGLFVLANRNRLQRKLDQLTRN